MIFSFKKYACVKWWIVLVLLFSSEEAFSRYRDIKFEHFSIENGLSQNNVTCVAQDAKGFMWFGTRDGLSRFDGYTFTSFTHSTSDPTTLSSSFVNCIYEDRYGILWVGTREGINAYNLDSDTFRRYIGTGERQQGLSEHNIHCFYEDNKGGLWVGTDGGLKRYDRQQDKFVTVENISLVNTAVHTISEDRKGLMWIGTEIGLFSYDRSKSRIEPLFQNRIAPVTINDIESDWQGRIWIASDAGVYRYNPQTKEFRHFESEEDGLSALIVNDILEDRRGVIWMATGSGGLTFFNPDKETFTQARHEAEKPQSLSHDIVYCLYENLSGIIWIGTYNGLDKFDQGREVFRVYSSELSRATGEVAHDVSALAQSSNGAFWIGGSTNELLRFSKSDDTNSFELEHIDSDEGMEFQVELGSGTNTLLEDREGSLWLGTPHGLGLYEKEKGTFRYFFQNEQEPESGPVGNNISSLLEDSNGFIWVGTDMGLSKFDPSSLKFKHFTKSEDKNSLSENNVWCITQDAKGFLWIGTVFGLNRFDPKTETFKVYSDDAGDEGPNNNYIVAAYRDSEDNLWFGTHGGGVSKYISKEDRFLHFTESEGLPNDVVYAIVQDNEGNIWVSTNKGISKFNHEKQKFRNFDINDGLKSNRFETGAVCKTKNGELAFGGINGVDIFHPDSIEDNPFLPMVHVTDFKIFNQTVEVGGKGSVLNRHISETDTVLLSYKDYVISFEFVALSYRRPQKNQYAYMLENFDTGWVYTDHQKRFAAYTNLKPGQYVFKVKASNNDGEWNDTGTTLHIIIEPPIWARLWFKIGAAFLVGAVLFGFYQMRIRQVQRQKQKLTEQVAHRTYELNAEKEKLEGAYEEIKQKNNQITDKNDELEVKQAEILEQRNEIERAFGNIRVLSDIGQEITAILDADYLESVVYKHVNSLMDASGFGIGIFDEKTNLINFQNFMEKGKVLDKHADNANSEELLSAWCLRNQQEVFMNDLLNEYPERFGKKDLEAIKGNLPRSLVYLPLSIKNRPIGVITVQSFKKNAYTEEHLTILKTLASYVAIALDNAKAYQGLNSAKKTIEETNLRLMDSLRYARTIQEAILPTENTLCRLFDDAFVIFRPKDVVSGDFYWVKESESSVFIAVADCTGHGVPGAFMSMIGSRLLNEIILRGKERDPAKALENLHEQIRYALKQDQEQNNDGMDIVLCRIDRLPNDEFEVLFAGAKRPLLAVSGDNYDILKGNRRSIGGRQKRTNKPFIHQRFIAKKGDILYLSSDGYPDQPNDSRKKFGSHNLQNLIIRNSHFGMKDQRTELIYALEEHQQSRKQRDDITLIGIKL